MGLDLNELIKGETQHVMDIPPYIPSPQNIALIKVYAVEDVQHLPLSLQI